MAQEVVIAGAVYSDVPSILVPDSNNVYHPFIDTSDATARAGNIVNPYTAYVNGAKVTGTASLSNMSIVLSALTTGGQLETITGITGLIYESGEWTPESDIDRGTISYAGTHTTPPMFAIVVDTTESNNNTANTNVFFAFADAYQANGYGFRSSSSVRGSLGVYGRWSNTSNISYTGFVPTYNSANTGASSTSYSRYYADVDALHPFTGSSYYWRGGRTYSWYAVWKP